MAGSIAISMVFGWLAAMNLATTATPAWPNAALVRLVAMIFLQLSSVILVCAWYRDWAGGVTAVTGAAFGALLASMCCFIWRGRKSTGFGWALPGRDGRTL